MKINLNKSPSENCPSYDRCATNACPLHPNYHKTLWDLPEDKPLHGWRKCRANKKVRLRIAETFGLKNLGLTEKEHAGMRLSIKMKQHDLITKGKEQEIQNNTNQEVN